MQDMTKRGTSFGPERPRGQGLGPHQAESGNRAILSLLQDPVVKDQVDLVITWRQPRDQDGADGPYEVWARRGIAHFLIRLS